jgi:chromosome partitioning protein
MRLGYGLSSFGTIGKGGPMRKIAVINQKGGVGKTTTTVNLAASLAQSGARVLTIDLDPQGHLTLHFGQGVTEGQPSIYDVLTSGTSVSESAIEARERLSVVPADIDLAAAESELISVTGREVLLREAVNAVASAYDYLLIDCPPSLGVLTVNALVAAEEIIIPLQCQFFALQGLSRLFDTVLLVKQRINPALKVSGIVLCMHESQTRLGNEVVDDLTRFLSSARDHDVPWSEAVVFKTCIRRNIKLAEATSFGQSIFEYAPRSNGALDYAELTDEIFGATAELVTPDSRGKFSTELEPAERMNQEPRVAAELSARSSYAIKGAPGGSENGSDPIKVERGGAVGEIDRHTGNGRVGPDGETPDSSSEQPVHSTARPS